MNENTGNTVDKKQMILERSAHDNKSIRTNSKTIFWIFDWASFSSFRREQKANVNWKF